MAKTPSRCSNAQAACLPEDDEFSKKRMNKILADIYGREWFRRRWVIQELLLSTDVDVDVLIGSHRFHLNCLQGRWHATSPRLLSVFFGLREFKQWQGTNIERTLLENLVLYERNQCSEPRDRVYALLSVSSDGHNSIVGYTVSEDSLYQEVAGRHMDRGKGAEKLLRAACNIPRPIRALPSWVPDWSGLRHRSARRWQAPGSLMNCEVSLDLWGGTKAQDHMVLCGDRLRVEGWPMGPCHRESHEPDNGICPQSLIELYLEALTTEDRLTFAQAELLILPPSADDMEIDMRRLRAYYMPCSSRPTLATSGNIN